MWTRKQSFGIRGNYHSPIFYHQRFSTRTPKLKFVMFLILCVSICHFIVQLDFGGNQTDVRVATSHPSVNNTQTRDTLLTTPNSKPPLSKDLFDFVHLDSESGTTNDHASLLMIFPHVLIQDEASLDGLIENDQRALEKLSEFLVAMKEFDGATCLDSSEIEHSSKLKKVNTATKVFLESSRCRFAKRKWSVNIRNTGRIERVKLKTASTEAEVIVFQHCNILQGPFVIRKDVFHRIGGLIKDFGKITLLEFFLRSKGELKMAKLSNCRWTRKIARADRGSLQGSNDFSEYASFGNKHQIIRIVTESRIEWTSCIANWKLCPEKPYERPRELPGIATPICCSVVLGQMLWDFTRALTRLGLEYRIIYGTLLGAVRSKAIIPWTHDLDIAISYSAIMNESTIAALEEELGCLYYVGRSYMNVHRAHRLMPPYIDVDTVPFFYGPNDLDGNALFSDEIEEAVRDMLPVFNNWRARGYIDLYGGHLVWMNDSSLVTINNQTYTTVKEVNYELTNWYGENYFEPSVKGNWVGLSDAGTA